MGRRAFTGWALCVVCCAVLAGAAAAVPEVEPNDAQPQPLGSLSLPASTRSVEGTSDYAGDLDWYSFGVEGTEPQDVCLVVDSPASWQIVLYTDGLSHVASGTGSLDRALAPGTYRVRIQAAELGVGSYTLLISNSIEHESNDGLAEATVLGAVQTEPLTVFASIDPAGDVDFFSFDVPTGFSAGLLPGAVRMLRIDTPCPAGDTLAVLYAESGSLARPVPILRNDDSGVGSWSRLYLIDPAPGRYTLRIHEYADNEVLTSYRVTIASLTLTDVEPNDSPAEATALGELRPGGRLETTQFVGEADIDAFSFSVSSTLCVVAETSGASQGDSIICLFDSEGAQIARDDDGGEATWSRLLRELPPGRYTVTVQALDETRQFDYTLTLTTAACPSDVEESEPNNTTSSADPLVLPVDIVGEVSPDDPDTYAFTLSGPAVVAAETSGSEEGDTVVCILREDGETVLCDDDGGEGLWSLARTELDPGTYFIRVELYAGKGTVSYHLVVRVEE